LVVLRAGLASNPVSLTVLAGPVLTAVEPAAATSGTSLRLSGAGFGGALSAVSVSFGPIAVAPSAVSASELRVTVPAGVSDQIEMRVTSAGRVSNPQLFLALVEVQGRVVLPDGSLLTLAGCTLRSVGDTGAVPAADGRFSIAAASHGVVTLVDADERVLLAAAVSAEPELRIDTLSTVCWLVFQSAGGAELRPAARTQALTELAATPALGAFAAALAPRLAAQPVLRLALADPALAASHVEALQVGRAIVRNLVTSP
jgi:hypothetical protein